MLGAASAIPLLLSRFAGFFHFWYTKCPCRFLPAPFVVFGGWATEFVYLHKSDSLDCRSLRILHRCSFGEIEAPHHGQETLSRILLGGKKCRFPHSAHRRSSVLRVTTATIVLCRNMPLPFRRNLGFVSACQRAAQANR
jgi:hypothetical protein